MKLVLNVLVPLVYEYIDSEDMENIVYISHPDPLPGADKLWEMYENSPLWRNSKCMGIDFEEKLRLHGYELKDYVRDCSYTLSGEAAKALVHDIKNYKEATLLHEKPLEFDIQGRYTVYEFTNKTDGTSLLLMDPEYEKLDMQVLPCKNMATYEIDVPSQSAVDYYTSESLYVIKETGFDEIISGLNVPEDFKNLKFVEGHMILRWEGLLKEDEEKPEKPWRVRLESLREEIDKVLNMKTCSYLKDRKIKQLINKFYGNL